MKTLVGVVSLMTLGALSFSAQAGIHQDSHGNVGYDTLQECQQAINSGTARFYKSSTFKKPLLHDNEVSVSKGLLGNLAPQFQNGTCDIGTGHRQRRDGVAKAIQGKYIPYSPEMMINQYHDASGRIVRVSMHQCDNWFSGAFPKGMPVVPPPQPVPQPAPQPLPTVQTPPPVVQPVTPPPPAPTPAVVASSGGIPIWAPVAAAAVIGIAIAASGDDDNDSGTSGTTGTK
ncbi:hypothetical protein [Psychrobacter phenylpyruvicus]|uniref:Uncharacterized protein n=1 Tax=Psychrobacter phenylpyruvicus TaxID=29432 RepID=A0A379LNC3_9GAMM|nr:hypothetical protein [Psychrobacter phenylpyruvicus]SUD91951.1 Uncharacterised protein [Psychrobacter phenylpyruvicus]